MINFKLKKYLIFNEKTEKESVYLIKTGMISNLHMHEIYKNVSSLKLDT